METTAIVEELARVAPGGRVLPGEAALELVRDSWPLAFWWGGGEVAERRPLAAVRPGSEAEAAAVLQWAGRRGVPVVPRGGGSSVVGSAVPEPGAVILDLTGLDARFEIGSDAQGPTVAAGAGMLGCALEQRLNAGGLSLLHFPASLDVSTVGGWIATRSYGQLSTRYGGIERQVLSLRVAAPDGRLWAEAPGLHLGAEGTLGVITEATLRVRPLPRSRIGWGLDFAGLGSALAFARGLCALPAAQPSVLRLYGPVDARMSLRAASRGGDGGLRRLLESFALRNYRWVNACVRLLPGRWTLVAIYEGPSGEEEAALAGLRPRPLRMDPRPALHWWDRRYHWSLERLRRTFAEGAFADTLDLWGSWELLPELERGVREAVSPHAFTMAHCSHLEPRGACLYVTIAGRAGTPAATRALHERAWKAGMDACVRLGGRTNHHHGVGLAKLPWIDAALEPSWRDSLRAAKRAADPRGILNPGKLGLDIREVPGTS